ncbi:hypothetical protein [Dyadobacter fermentans]|uniref:hypothetical protein n=1 Tax=Dyadobacter fermentans TaxID=94254 RepID=UPI001CBDD54D|nr:hypothetical protein [Dyadobacter fermentans]MBZ1362172.1 hypothetical protein [Dyadobacter fermentans]
MKKLSFIIIIAFLLSCEEGDPLGPKKSPCGVVVQANNGVWGTVYKGKFGRCFIYDGKKKINVDKEYCDCK